jgi:hypothetical protein
MNDAELTQALRHIGVDRHTIRALPLLPLVQVAWADGRVQPAERGLIREVAARYGLEPHEMALLKRWLEKRPEDADFLLARQVLLVLWSRDRDRGQAPESLDGVIRMCMCVARVAGGLFGLAFTLDAREIALIGEISKSLQLGPSLSSEARSALPQTALLGPQAHSVGGSIADDATQVLPSRSPPRHAISPEQRLDAAIDPMATAPEVDTTLRTASPRMPTPKAATDRIRGAPRPRNLLRMGGPDADFAFNSGPGGAGATLLPIDDEDASTMPLSSLRKLLHDEDETELDIPPLSEDYDFDLD